MKALHVDAVYCLGDLVGWLPFGDRIFHSRELLTIPTVAGNHDLLVTGLIADHPSQKDRMQASAYNAGLLSTVPGALDYLARLPLLLEEEEFVVVHHSPFHLPSPGRPPEIHHFHYLDQAALADCLDRWRLYPKKLVFSGHDHIPVVYELPATAHPPSIKDVTIHRPEGELPLTISLEAHSRYWIKAGSLGGPYRDGLPLANPVLYDSSEQTVTLFRLPFATDALCRELASHRFMMRVPTLRDYRKLLEEFPCQNQISL